VQYLEEQNIAKHITIYICFYFQIDLRKNQTIFLFIYYVRNESNIYFVNFSFFKRYNTEKDRGPQYS